jgi:hypothetical protein
MRQEKADSGRLWRAGRRLVDRLRIVDEIESWNKASLLFGLSRLIVERMPWGNIAGKFGMGGGPM